MTLSRLLEQRSVSMSGGVLRAGFRKRSKYKFNANGSGLVISRQCATKDDAAEPLEDIGTPELRAKSRISFTMRNKDAYPSSWIISNSRSILLLISCVIFPYLRIAPDLA